MSNGSKALGRSDPVGYSGVAADKNVRAPVASPKSSRFAQTLAYTNPARPTIVRFAGAHLDTATSPRPDLPLLLWRRGLGRGGCPVGKPLPPGSANPSMPLSPTLSPRSAGGEREKSLVAVSRCAYATLPGKNERRPYPCY